jgi:hypothetical protein
MNIEHYDLSELQTLLINVSKSQHPDKTQLIRAVQNKIADKKLSQLQSAEWDAVQAKLATKTAAELKGLIESFYETNLQVPRVLMLLHQDKVERESRALLERLLEEPEAL